MVMCKLSGTVKIPAGIDYLFLPLLILSVILTVSMTVILMRHIMQKARMLDENTFLLEQARLNLITSEKRFRDVSETTSDWFWETDLSLKITPLSGRFSTVTDMKIANG